MDKTIKIYHINWIDDLFLDYNKNIIKRINYNNDSGKFILIDNILLIIWEKWEKEYFFSYNNVEYYQISDNNYFNLDYEISIIYLIDELFSGKYIINNNLQKIYNMNNLDHYGNFILDNNNLIFSFNGKNSEYIYFNNKYYNKKILDKKYEIIYINNKKYFLDKSLKICYENNNLFTKKDYSKYKNKLLYDNNIYYTVDNINYIKDNINNNYKLINDFNNIENINQFKILINVDDIHKIINLIEYYIYFNINYIFFDNIINIKKNNIFDNLNIVYYNNIEEVINLLNIKIFNDIYINSIEKNIFTSDNNKL